MQPWRPDVWPTCAGRVRLRRTHGHREHSIPRWRVRRMIPCPHSFVEGEGAHISASFSLVVSCGVGPHECRLRAAALWPDITSSQKEATTNQHLSLSNMERTRRRQRSRVWRAISIEAPHSWQPGVTFLWLVLAIRASKSYGNRLSLGGQNPCFPTLLCKRKIVYINAM